MIQALLILMGGMVVIGCDQAASSRAGHAETPGSGSISADSTGAAVPVMAGNLFAPTNTLRSFVARGVIRELSADRRSAVISHEEVPGVMPKMTMTFTLRDPEKLGGLAAGDTVKFRVRATDEESWIEDVTRADATEALPRPDPELSPSLLLHAGEMKTGEVLPDAELLAEDGRTIHLSDFSGRAVAFTFLFTRCPLPDFCPRMSQNFQRARRLLLARPGGPTNWQFLSISFDPEFDRAGVLKRYGEGYRAGNPDRWLFASAPSEVMATMSARLDFRFTKDGGSFLHNLRTVVVDPERRVYRQFDGNQWKAEELAEALAGAASAPAPTPTRTRTTVP